MLRVTTSAVAVFVAVSVCGGVLAAPPAPLLVSADSRGGHVVVTFSLGGLAPGIIVAATSRRTDESGALTSGVKFRASLRVAAGTRLVRWRSRGVLRPGRYFVQVSGVDAGGVTDCLPKQRVACGEQWSNIRSVIVGGR